MTPGNTTFKLGPRNGSASLAKMNGGRREAVLLFAVLSMHHRFETGEANMMPIGRKLADVLRTIRAGHERLTFSKESVGSSLYWLLSMFMNSVAKNGTISRYFRFYSKI